MDYDKNICPIVDVEGVIENGKQFDIEINLPEDNRNVIFGVVKDCYKEPVQNAVVKLIEVVCDKGHEEKRPVSHTLFDRTLSTIFILYLKFHLIYLIKP